MQKKANLVAWRAVFFLLIRDSGESERVRVSKLQRQFTTHINVSSYAYLATLKYYLRGLSLGFLRRLWAANGAEKNEITPAVYFDQFLSDDTLSLINFRLGSLINFPGAGSSPTTTTTTTRLAESWRLLNFRLPL